MKAVAIFLAVYLFIGSLFPANDFSQLLQISHLLNHYENHQREMGKSTSDYSLFDFFVEHYISAGNHEHVNGNAHDNLPFQSLNSSINFHVAAHSFQLESNKIIPIIFNFFFFKNRFYLSGFLSKTIKPPSS